MSKISFRHSNKIIITEEINHCPICFSSNKKRLFKCYDGASYVKCVDCDVVFQNPRNEISYEEEYQRKSIDPDGKERFLENERDIRIKNFFKDDIKYVERLNGGKILDAGCGFGFFLSALSTRWEKYGNELSKYCVNFAIKNFKDIKKVKFATIESNPYPENFFDVIYSSHVIEHVKDPKQHIMCLKRMLKKGGTLIMSTPNIDSFVARRFKGNYRLLGHSHIIMFSPKTLSKILIECGFDVGQIKFPFFNTGYFNFQNLLRLFNTNRVSSAFYGNFMTFYAKNL